MLLEFAASSSSGASPSSSSSSSSWARVPNLLVGNPSSSARRRPISSLDPPETPTAVEALRSRVAFLSPSTAHVFSASVEDNVAAAADRPTTGRELAAAVEGAGLSGWVAEALPDGLRTRVGPRSTGPLSRSVAVRVALARCLLRGGGPAEEAVKLLVVDEPAALLAVAAEDVSKVLKRFSESSEECAVVLVEAKGAAADAVAELADEVVDLDSGA